MQFVFLASLLKCHRFLPDRERKTNRSKSSDAGTTPVNKMKGPNKARDRGNMWEWKRFVIEKQSIFLSSDLFSKDP